jgi:DNA polymerase-3 subunit epsilon
LYTIVDIETTGGSSKSHKIIEIAIVNFDGNSVVDTYSTLINPQRYIPPFITSLTGITNEMVESSPTFEEVADTILERTNENIFVAHNVNFDYGFIKQEFSDIGVKFDRKKLCTVRLAKKIVPGFRSYGLGTLTHELGVTIHDRHRALGDAEATAKVLELLIEKDINDFIGHSLKRNSREATLPPNLSKSVFDNLPDKAGVYYFHNEKGKVVYVGKAKNIKSRITSHFTGDSGKRKRLFHENIHNISYELTGNELVALLLESREIKRLWPEYNRIQKFTSGNHGLFCYTDRNGYERFSIAKMKAGMKAIAHFRNFQEARSVVHELVKTHKLCPKLCGLQKSDSACFDHKLGICDGACKGTISAEYYNKRMELALESIEEEKKTYAIIGHGRTENERTLVLVENGAYLGHGFTSYDLPANSFEELRDRINPFPDNQDIQKILSQYLKNPNGEQVVYF